MATAVSASQQGIFDSIIGYDDVKQVFNMALKAQQPVHILMCGPPASAKSLFLLELEEELGDQCLYTDGLSMTKEGLYNMLFQRKPRYLLIEEIDKASMKERNGLLNLMETGRIVETKVKTGSRELRLDVSVFAACNRVQRFTPEQLSRWLKYQFTEYTFDEFRRIAITKLAKDRKSPALIDFIAERVWNDLNTRDFRQVVYIARMAMDIDSATIIINSMKKYPLVKA